MSDTRILIKHHVIIHAMLQLGYQISAGGICNGLTHKWIEAVILGPAEEQKYFARLALIAKFHTSSWERSKRQNSEQITSDLITQINAAKKKVIHHEALTDMDMQFLEVLAFFDGLALFQVPAKYSDVFNRTLKQININDIEQFTQSKMAETQHKSMQCIYSVPRIFDLNTLSAYFAALEKMTDLEKDQLIIGLGSEKHRIGLKYNQRKKRWELFNANNIPPILLSSDQDQLASHIMQALKDDNITAFSFSIYSSAQFQNKTAIINQLEELEKKFPINDERLCKLTNNRGYSIVNIAAHKNLTNKLELLTDHLVLDESRQATTFLHRAAIQGHVTFFQKILTLNPTINLNLRKENNNCPIHLAVIFNRCDLITFLLEHNAALDLAGTNGDLPLHMAIKYNHKIAAELLLNKMDTNDLVIKNKFGQTPLHLAVQKGQLTIIKALLKKKGNDVLTIQNDKGETALDIAIRLRNDKVIKLIQSFLPKKMARLLGLLSIHSSPEVMFKEKKESQQQTQLLFCRF